MYTLSNLPKPKTPSRPSRPASSCNTQDPPPYAAAADGDAVILSALSILSSRLAARPVVCSPKDLENFLRLSLHAEPREVFGVVLMDNRHRVLDAVPLFFGTIDGASVYPREVVRLALLRDAAAVSFYHNRPSGSPIPSAADRAITDRLKAALAAVDVRVLDHLIVASGGSYSFAEHNLI